jgi:hypothetical protein
MERKEPFDVLVRPLTLILTARFEQSLHRISNRAEDQDEGATQRSGKRLTARDPSIR